MKRIFGLSILALMAAGCNGTIYVDRLPNQTVTNQDGTQTTVLSYPREGVTFYEPVYVLETYGTNILVDDKGNILRRYSDPSNQCSPIPTQKLAVRPDLENPLRIYYDSGLLESAKFGVTLAEGMLTAVNTESAPDRASTIGAIATGVAALAEQSIFTLDGVPTAPSLPACNKGAQLLAVRTLDNLAEVQRLSGFE